MSGPDRLAGLSRAPNKSPTLQVSRPLFPTSLFLAPLSPPSLLSQGAPLEVTFEELTQVQRVTILNSQVTGLDAPKLAEMSNLVVCARGGWMVNGLPWRVAWLLCVSSGDRKRGEYSGA